KGGGWAEIALLQGGDAQPLRHGQKGVRRIATHADKGHRLGGRYIQRVGKLAAEWESARVKVLIVVSWRVVAGARWRIRVFHEPLRVGISDLATREADRLVLQHDAWCPALLEGGGIDDGLGG